MITQQARVTDPLMVQCWFSFYDADTTIDPSMVECLLFAGNSATGTVKAFFCNCFILPHFAIYITVCDD